MSCTSSSLLLSFFGNSICCLFHPSITAVAHKRPWSFCQKNMLPVTNKLTDTRPDRVWVGWHSVGISGKQTHTQLLSGNTPLQLSWLTEPLQTDPGIKSGISTWKLMLTFKKKKKKKVQAGNGLSSLPPKCLACEEKASTIPWYLVTKLPLACYRLPGNNCQNGDSQRVSRVLVWLMKLQACDFTSVELDRSATSGEY